MKSWYYKIVVVTAFAFAMGLLEAVVVVYLREIYFPLGFSFPLAEFDTWMLKVELTRELTTMVMLVSVGLLAGTSKNGKLAWFLFAFGTWDIAYYIGLKAFLDWPASLLTWDILFLIPVTWVGPVLAPVLCSITMIFMGIMISWFESKGIIVRFGRVNWLLLFTGALLIFITYVRDYYVELVNAKGRHFAYLFSWTSMKEVSTALDPEQYNWWLFAAGLLLILIAVFKIYLANTNLIKHRRPDKTP